ncbi:MAG: filamentous hemagglutinin N-terminal domain-containing protein, partial [Cetobacterium sp.]
MREINFNEKLLKRQLKNKRKITLSLIVAFLISGGFGFEEVEARDLRTRKKESNNIVPDYGGPGLNKSANDTDVVNIVDPNSSGISHNKFVDLSVGNGNGLIFNNSTDHGISQIGGHITKNPNLNKSASVILNEVTGNNISNINGDIEVFGGKADFILANENGINLNGATFINTSGVTLSTGTPTVNGNNIDFNVRKGNINLSGVGTSGNYFNVIAKTIQLHNQIAPLSGESNPDIALIAGENIVTTDKGNINIIHSKNVESEKYGIYASNLGAMYGKNIRLISTDKGLGVKH